MTDSLRIGKRALTTAVAAATILWSVGFAAFVAPMTASAASAGDVIRGTTLSTLYFLASDGKRYAFPNEKTYMSWYSDFSGVQTLSDSALAAIPLAGNIVYRPGARWIKIQSDAKTYAVTPQGQIRWIETEAVAQALAGDNWNTFIDDVPDVFFVDYTVGTSLISASNGYNGLVLEEGGKNYLLWNNQKREVTASGFSANRFQSRHVLPADGVNLAGMTAGAAVTAQEAGLVDAAQLGNAVTGGLSISLASDTPASATIPAGADSVEFAKFKLTANSGSANVNQIVLTLGGVGAVSNIENVYLYNGNNRITKARSVNSSTRQATFSGLNLNLTAGESMNLSVRVDTATAAEPGDTASFSIAATSDVSGTASVSGNFPVAGNVMSFSGTEAGSVTIDKNGTISSPTIGEENAVIGKFSVEADTEDVMLKQITVNVDDSADHSNYMLWKGSTKLANGTVEGDLVSFVLTNPLLIEDGDNENLEVSADIGGDAGDTVGVSVEEEVDVVAIGTDFNFNVSVDISGYDGTGNNCDDSGDDCSFSTIQGGELTFAFNGPTSDDILLDGDDQVFMNFSITAEQAVEINELDLIVAGDDLLTGAEANLENITIRLASGQVWMGPEELNTGGSDTSQSVTFDDDQLINAGQTLDLVITADVVNEPAIVDAVYNVTIDMSTVEAEDANGDTLDASDIVPSADLVGNDMTVTDSSLTVSVSQPPASGTYVKGTQAVPVLGLAFEAGDAADVVVTDLTLGADGDSTVGGGVTDGLAVNDFVNSCSLYDAEDGSLIDGPESFDATTEQADFENFSWSVDAGETMKMIVKCNYANVDTTGGNNDEYNFFVDATDDITAEDADGDDVSVDFDGAADLNLTSEDVVITISAGGTLAVSLDGSTAKSNIVLGLSTGVAMSKFKFQADDEDFLVKELTLANCVDTDNADDGTCNGTDGVDSALANVKISYTNQSGATVTKTGFLTGGTVKFTGLDLFVPADTTRVLTVTADTNQVKLTAPNSGDQVQLNFAGNLTFEAIGLGSNETIDEGDLATYVPANDMTLRKTKPTISLASGSPSGAGVPGLADVLRFTVAADSRGFVTLNEITFKVTAADTDGDWSALDTDAATEALTWELFDADNSSEKLDDNADWSFFTSAGVAAADTDLIGFAVLTLDGNATAAEEIGAGQVKTYVLRYDTTGANPADDDSIRIDIPDQTEAASAGLDAIVWEDDTVLTGDIDGEFVKNLPVTGGTIVY